MKTKICCKCKIEKDVSEFHKYKKGSAGVRSECKACRKVWQQINSQQEGIRVKHWSDNNKEKVKKYQKLYRKQNKNILNIYKAIYRKNHRQELRDKAKIYSKNHKIENNIYRKQRRKIDPKYRLNCNIRTAILKSLKGNKNGRAWTKLVGYTVDDLKKHLEKLFTEGMSWDKFLKGEIQVDHKTPIAVFNFTSPDHKDFRRCWRLKNLQPMWAKDNLAKGAKLEHHFQPSLLI